MESVPEVEETKVVSTEKPVVVGKRKLKLKGGSEEKPVAVFSGAGAHEGMYRDFSPNLHKTVEIDGETYASARHYYEMMKAKHFGDEEIMEKIRKSPSPQSAKALGKKVKGFHQEDRHDRQGWESVKKSHMIKCMRAKFNNPALRTLLMSTEDKIIGYADARNIFWGIGCGLNTPRAEKPSVWRGDNHLGKILMELREEFKGENGFVKA